MQVEHIVKPTDEEVSALFDIPVLCLKATYATSELEKKALEDAKMVFKKKLSEVAQEAFDIGRKIGKKKADKKDTEMYKPEVKV